MHQESFYDRFERKFLYQTFYIGTEIDFSFQQTQQANFSNFRLLSKKDHVEQNISRLASNMFCDNFYSKTSPLRIQIYSS